MSPPVRKARKNANAPPQMCTRGDDTTLNVVIGSRSHLRWSPASRDLRSPMRVTTGGLRHTREYAWIREAPNRVAHGGGERERHAARAAGRVERVGDATRSAG